MLKIILNKLCIIAMSNFFEKSDLSRNDAESIISDTLKKCDDGELYLENSKSESILLDDNKIKNSSYSSDLGFGFRASIR
jgi:TldD protein